MSEFEKKFGKYAVKNLTIKLIACYIIGYILYYAPSGVQILDFLTLDPYKILHGQVWRLVSWILVPPNSGGSNIFFTLIMLYFYYSIGTTMEGVWGRYKYNLYIFTGLILMIVAAFLTYIIICFQVGTDNQETIAGLMQLISMQYMSTYYINMSILLAFAATFPDNVILFMFIIPLKMKWLGIFYGIYLAFEALNGLVHGAYYVFMPIAASLMTFAIFWLTSGRFMHLRPREIKRRNQFKRSVKITPPGISRHKCAVCGRTEEDYPDGEFRFCSKCNGNYEYCKDHLFTHEHVK